ncbi:hypothetical protein SteCoe_26814 [Stentor coeruleus]|uniref:DUF4200 domain-containing protein n=1 Tax=Stentor coeruleus TaxID=5963 RepID=A0A1R2BC08_9CILI|nr:hypothetical protein SteCoe_26814 [Stentor coeruleus]
MKRTLRPLDVMSAREREQMYSRTHSEVHSYQFESQTIRLLKKEKKERAISQELANKLVLYKEKSFELEEKYRQMAFRQEQIKQNIESKKNSIQNYDNKAKHELDKLKKEEELIKVKEEDIKKKKADKSQITEQLQEIEKKIDEYSKYKKLLEDVVNSTEDYEDIPQLMSRYWTLKKSVEDLNFKCRKIEEDQEKEKQRHLSTCKNLKESIAMNTSYLHNLENEVEELNTKISILQANQEESRRNEIMYKGMTGKIALSIKNIYSSVVKHKISEDDKDSNSLLLEMLEKIKHRYEDLKAITASIQEEPVVVKKQEVPQTETFDTDKNPNPQPSRNTDKV